MIDIIILLVYNQKLRLLRELLVFVDEKTISPADIGGLVWALTRLAREIGNRDWTNRICFPRR